MDSRKHENRPGLGCEGLPSSKRSGIEIMVESLFRDRTVSWDRIVNGINKYVTETSGTISLEHVKHSVTGKPVANAEPRPIPTVTDSCFFSCSCKELDRCQSREIP